MITSMTGFGLADRKNKNFSIEINIKSTNNRFFDLNIRIPSTINSLEKIIHDKCKEYFIRGSIQLFCKIKLNDLKSNNTKIDSNKLDSLYKSIVPIDKKFNKTNVSLNVSIDNILSKLISDEFDLNEKNQNLILNTFEKAFSDLLKSRKSEGKKIEKEIKNNLKIIKNINSKLIKLEDNILVINPISYTFIIIGVSSIILYVGAVRTRGALKSTLPCISSRFLNILATILMSPL